MVKPKFIERNHLPKRARESYEGEYVNGVKNSKGEVVIRPLNKDEAAFLDQFNSEWCLNNHGNEDSLHRQLPDYFSKIKKQMNTRSNARNREIFLEPNWEYREDVETASIFNFDEWKSKLVIHGFDKTIDMLIDHTSEVLQPIKDPKIRKNTLFRFALTVFRFTYDESREQRKEYRSKLKERNSDD